MLKEKMMECVNLVEQETKESDIVYICYDSVEAVKYICSHYAGSYLFYSDSEEYEKEGYCYITLKEILNEEWVKNELNKLTGEFKIDTSGNLYCDDFLIAYPFGAKPYFITNDCVVLFDFLRDNFPDDYMLYRDNYFDIVNQVWIKDTFQKVSLAFETTNLWEHFLVMSFYPDGTYKVAPNGKVYFNDKLFAYPA